MKTSKVLFVYTDKDILTVESRICGYDRDGIRHYRLSPESCSRILQLICGDDISNVDYVGAGTLVIFGKERTTNKKWLDRRLAR